MGAENFQFIDDTTSDDSITKRKIVEKYFQHGAHVDDENQKINFYLGENLNYSNW